MQSPDVLLSLTDQGVIDEVLRPLKSGKEAQVFLVRVGGDVRVAKVYKDAQHRSFKQRAQYTEGRRVRNTRDQRAIDKRTHYGKSQLEDGWKSTEVNLLHRLHAHGVRVPTPYNFIDGVLIMELVCGDDGNPAPRLGELALDPETARAFFELLLQEVVTMLCAGVVHGDLSDYNVLVDSEGPVIIDFPQSVDAAQNRNAQKLLVRDVDNLSAFLGRHIPGVRRRPYGQEMWAAYENNLLTPGFELTGQFKRSTKATNMDALLDEIEDAEKDEQRRREASGQTALPMRRREVVIAPADGKEKRASGRRPKRGARKRPAKNAKGQNSTRPSGPNGSPAPVQAAASKGEGAPKRRRRRRRRGAAAPGGDSANRSENRQPQQRTQGASGPSRPTSANSPSEGDAPKKRRRRRRRRRKGPDGQAGQPGETTRGEASSPATKTGSGDRRR